VSRRPRIAVRGLEARPRTLDASASRHLGVVLRLDVGDDFVAFDPERGVEADGRIVRVERGVVHVDLGEIRAARALAPVAVTWIQGLAKGEKMDAIVRDATELGATKVVPVTASFSVTRLDGPRADARRKRWTKIAEEAARQCGRADPPAISRPCSLGEAISIAGPAARFFLFERATEPLGPLLMEAVASRTPMAFAAGPEGGWSGAEVAEATAAGFAVVSLGSFVLRTETVVAAVLGATRMF
jgi:16S rRNA (uracil1498-N3)-methyltransferase